MEKAAVEARRAYKRAWRAKNKDKVNAYTKKWRSENPDRVTAAQERYWLKKSQQAGQEEIKSND